MSECSKVTRRTCYRVVVIVMIFVLIFSASAFAATPEISIEEAKAYLTNYSEEKMNEYGEPYTLSYEFKDEEDLEMLANYIVANGVDGFNAMIEEELQKVAEKEPQQTSPPKRIASPSVIHKSISGDGRHVVSATTSGLVSFDKCGSVEYRVELRYTVTVKNGEFVSLTTPSFRTAYISPTSATIDDVSLPNHCKPKEAGVTANYTVTGRIELQTPAGSITLVSENKRDIFALIADIA